MRHAIEIYSPNGYEVREYPMNYVKDDILDVITLELQDAEWYRIRYHVCRNDEQQPCDSWETVIVSGDVPESEELPY